ncbi:TetR/AcrR family transcriptional regulator [Mycobacterium yunnanensis]|uniref:TetR/AcrR family transcriptional regulator n=1 Tax=Mycobacterium yunnanensis TaxID=368477 RepID=A0A9X2YYS1_9MYCO|nr:TetR/AcrR family transcriptional regulator [Mycobacterium yunnanensis]MCV7420569.1 TetR/AcrR family transcriptional regulator [Mycobacterium yunnanensis]
MARATVGASSPPPDAGSTRETILRTAAQVFLAHGYQEASMDQIALESGMARRTLYNQFGSKKALFDATMAHMWEKMPLDSIIAASASVSPPEEVLHTIGLTIAAFWAPPEAVAFMRLIIWESSRTPELGDSFVDNGREPARHAVREYVRQLSLTPDFEIADPDLASTQFIYAIVGEVLLARLVAPSTTDLDEQRRDYVVREAVALFLARYRVHP